MTPDRFTAVWIALYVAHVVADHWVQTGWEAEHKGEIGTGAWRGRLACAKHVATYTATALALLLVIAWRVGVELPPMPLVGGLLVNGAGHFVIDRRWTLALLARWAGKGEFYELGQPPSGGAYLLDQAAHLAILTLAALLIA